MEELFASTIPSDSCCLLLVCIPLLSSLALLLRSSVPTQMPLPHLRVFLSLFEILSFLLLFDGCVDLARGFIHALIWLGLVDYPAWSFVVGFS